MTDFEPPVDEWEEIEPELPLDIIAGADLLPYLGLDAQQLVALTDATAWALAKDMGLPGISAVTWRRALEIVLENREVI